MEDTYVQEVKANSACSSRRFCQSIPDSVSMRARYRAYALACIKWLPLFFFERTVESKEQFRSVSSRNRSRRSRHFAELNSVTQKRSVYNRLVRILNFFFPSCEMERNSSLLSTFFNDKSL